MQRLRAPRRLPRRLPGRLPGRPPRPAGLLELGRATLSRELLAGVNLLALALPLNIGYAQIAGLPPAAGLYALVVPGVVFALTAASRAVVASPDAAAAALVGSSLLGVAVAGGSEDYAAMAAAQALLCGAAFLVMSWRRLGGLARFLSEPVLVGFVAGLAVEVLASQLGKMTGVPAEHGNGAVRHVAAVLARPGEWHVATVLLSALCVAVLLVGRRLAARGPWALLVLVVSTVAAATWGLAERGVAVLGPVASGLPPLAWPQLPLEVWLALVPSALALTLVGSAEGLLVGRDQARRLGHRYDPDRDLAAYGLANVGAGLSGGFAVGCSVSRTSAVTVAGARTQLPSLVVAVGAVLLLLLGTALLEQVPAAAVGAVVAVAVVPLLRPAAFRRLWRRDRGELAVAVACATAVLALGPLLGVLVAFVLSVVDLARRAAAPPVEVLRDDGTGSIVDPLEDPTVDPTVAEVPGPVRQTAPGVVVVRVAGPLFFASAAAVDDGVRAAVAGAGEGLRHVVLDLEAVQTVDVTAGETLEHLAGWCREQGLTWSYSRVRPAVADRLAALGLLDGAVLHRTNRAAVDALSRGAGPPRPTRPAG